MSGVLRAAAPLARRLNAVSKGPATRSTRKYSADPDDIRVAYPWSDPMNPARWKSEHTVLTVLGTWAVVIGSAYSVFGPKSKPKETKPIA
mmetsp:Transcript_29441/g.47310  ORF Transcript_29441/g.47310 Transcript_29441/m.47310 type:complete len:90 (-) Transcript_29441:472-741(-)